MQTFIRLTVLTVPWQTLTVLTLDVGSALTVLIDGVAGTINAGALTGAPAIDGSALTGKRFKWTGAKLLFRLC